jgi:hypothetical protein
MEIGGHDFDGLEARGTQVIGNPLSGAFDIGLIFGFGADGRNAQKFQKLREMLFAATFDKFSKVHKSPGAQKFACQDNSLRISKKSAAAGCKRGSGQDAGAATFILKLDGTGYKPVPRKRIGTWETPVRKGN